MTSDSDSNARAWAWVLQHADTIRGIARRLGNGSGVDVDDLHAETIERIVRRFATYDPSASAPSTWVWWQTRAVQKGMVHERRRAKQCAELGGDADVVAAGLYQHPAGESAVMLRQLRELANDDEWNALLARGQGYEGAELGRLCGAAPFSVRRRATRFLNRHAS